jgi:hypothetical protein
MSCLIRCRAAHEVANEAIRTLMDEPAGADRTRAYRELLELWTTATQTYADRTPLKECERAA